MATLEELLSSAPDELSGYILTLQEINNRIADLKESKEEIIDRILWESRNDMDTWVSNKTNDLTTSDPDASTPPILAQYRYVLGGTFWNGEESQPAGATLNINDWEIQKRTRATELDPWSSWFTYYTYSNAEADEETEVINLNENFNYGWDYIIQDPTDQDGSYGINKNIETLETGLDIIKYDRDKTKDTEKILTRIIE